MAKKTLVAAAMAMASFSTAMAGGMLTNTNQSISFLRNPARDAAIGIDGVYSNPAGVAFMKDGLHVGFNWQCAWQTRDITTKNEVLKYGVNNNGMDEKSYQGKAHVPFLPSLQAAYNKGKWSFQFNFGITGGGGKCEFANGLGSFESAVGTVATKLQSLGATGYDMSSYMQGRQYYYSFTLGAAYKVKENLSVYLGLRGLYGSASYKAKIDNIQVNTANGLVPFSSFIDNASTALEQKLTALNDKQTQLDATHSAGQVTDAVYSAQSAQIGQGIQQVTQAQMQMSQLGVYREGVNLQCDQSGFGFAPIIGVDYKVGQFNFAAKYEFRTKMNMTNESTVKEANQIAAVNKFRDGENVREDSPALLAVGAQWTCMPEMRVNVGYHHFYDTGSKKYNDTQNLLNGGTDEYLGGVEYDINRKWTVSGGVQVTRYGNTDAFMNDMSFVVNSWSFGVGAKYQCNDKIAVNLGYFQTNYGKYTQSSADEMGSVNTFTRTNYVVGAGVEFDF